MSKIIKFFSRWLGLAVLLPVPNSQAQNVPEEVLLKTDAGEMVIALYRTAAPKTVANFLRYVDGGYYQNGAFYRVVREDNQTQNTVKIDVIQGGMNDNRRKSPFPPIPHETTRDSGILHKSGIVSMARLGPGTATSEFFICIGDQPELDYGGKRNPDGLGFAAFGKVVKGMAVVRRIQQMETDMPDAGSPEYTSGQILSRPVVIQSAGRVVGEGRD